MTITAKIRKAFEELHGFPLLQANDIIRSGSLLKTDNRDKSLDIPGQGDPTIRNSTQKPIAQIDENNLNLVNKLANYSQK